MFNNLIFLNDLLSNRVPRKEAKVVISIQYPDGKFWTIGQATSFTLTDQDALKKDVMDLLKKY